MQLNSQQLLTITLYTIILFEKEATGAPFNFFGNDVRNIVDDHVITPTRNTIIGLIARKMGIVDFFVNLKRGLIHTFLRSLNPEKPHYGYPPTTPRYKTSQYRETSTKRTYTKSSSKGGLHIITAPNLASSTQSLLNVDSAESGVETAEILGFRGTNFESNISADKKLNEVRLQNLILERLKSNPGVLISPFLKTVIKSINEQKVKVIKHPISQHC